MGQGAGAAWLGRRGTEKVCVKLAFWGEWRRIRRLRLDSCLSKQNEEIGCIWEGVISLFK